MRKYLPITAAIIVTLLLSVSCRNLVGDTVKDTDLPTARQSANALLDTEKVKGHVDSIGDAADDIAKQTQDDAVADKAEAIKEDAKEAAALLTGIHENLESIHNRSLGKTKWSWMKLLVVWIVGFVILGIAVRFVPFFQPVHRALCGIANLIMDTLSGFRDDMSRSKVEHFKRTENMPTEELPASIQTAIKKAEIQEIRNGG